MHAIRLRAAGCAVVVLCAGSGTPAHADDEMPLHRVTYTVTAELPGLAAVYYRDTDPPTWADYSHNPYQFSPRDDIHLTPGTPWVRDAMLADPDQWAMVTVTTAGQVPDDRQILRCQLAVDGVQVSQADGPRGALCSLRHW